MEKIKILGQVIYGAVLVLLLAVAGLVFLTNINFLGGYKLLVVKSGSMEPVIKVGAIVVIKPSSVYAKDDVVTFRDPTNPKESITHRIYEVKKAEFTTTYITKGDANNAPDLGEMGKAQVLGKVVFNIPYVGYVVGFAKTMTGLILLIVIPSAIIIYSELMNIKNEAIRLIQERRKRKLTTTEKIKEKIGEEIMEVEKEVKEVIKKNA